MKNGLIAVAAALWLAVMAMSNDGHDWHLVLLALATVSIGLTANHLVNLRLTADHQDAMALLIAANKVTLETFREVMDYGIGIGREEMREEMTERLHVVTALPARHCGEDCETCRPLPAESAVNLT